MNERVDDAASERLAVSALPHASHERRGEGVHVARIASAFAAFLAALLVFWVGLPLLAPAYLVLSIIALQEFTAMVALRGIRLRKRSLWVAAVLTLPASLPASYPGMQPLALGVSWRELLLGLFALYLIGVEIAAPRRDSLNTIVYSLFAYLYIPWLFGYVLTLRYTPDGVLGLWYLTLPMLAIVASDVGAYAIGSWLGRRKLAPLISPNKTVEGSLGGLILSVLVVAAATFLLERLAHLHVDLYDGLLFSGWGSRTPASSCRARAGCSTASTAPWSPCRSPTTS
ncbi:MAG: phosphatidate cytidylyltransferase [Deinococcales bacterium]